MSRNAGPPNPFRDRAEAFFGDAVAAGLPIFLTHETESTPLNATPYYARYERFREAAGGWLGRDRLVSELDRVIEEAERLNLSVDAILIGGSFTELDKAEIGDLDCLLFYRIRRPDQPIGSVELASTQHRAKARGIDARFVPLDGDPLALIKLTSYFTFLYSKRKGTNEIVRCLLLLDCRKGG